MTGQELAGQLRRQGVECEYADRDFLVLMATPENTPEELAQAGRGPGAVPWGSESPPAAPGPGGSAPAPSARRPLPPGKPWMPPTPWDGFAAFPQWAARRPSPLPFRGRAHHPRGPGAVRLLRHRASRGAGIEFLVGPEIEKTPERRWGLPGVFFLYPAITGSG